MTWSVQPGEEGTEGRPHFNIPMKGRGGEGADLFILMTSDRTG